MKKIDYNKPIFVYYINIEGLSRQSAENEVSKIISDFNDMDVQMWFVILKNTDDLGSSIEGGRKAGIECVWDPNGQRTDKSAKNLICEVIQIIDGISKDDDLKSTIREILLGRLLDDNTI
jgi:hypothetical protein